MPERPEVRPESGHASPRRGSGIPRPRGSIAGPAPAPSRPSRTWGTVQFLFLLIGSAALVGGTWNAERHRAVEELREIRDERLRERDHHESALAEQYRWYEGVESDPRVRRELLVGLLGPDEAEGIPLREWLARRDPDAGS